MNRYQNYYQGKKWNARPGTSIRNFYYDSAHSGVTDRQKVLYEGLLKFMRERDMPTSLYERPRNRNDCRSKIRYMINVIKRSEAVKDFDKFWEWYYREVGKE